MPPSPKVQFQLVGLPVDRPVKLTVKGAQQEVGVALNAATGASLMVTFLEQEAEQTPSVTVKLIVTGELALPGAVQFIEVLFCPVVIVPALKLQL